MVKCEILENGEEALFYRYDGQVSLKKGPKRIWLIRSRLTRLKRFNAKQDEYLKIKYKDGSVEHKIGPCHVFLNNLVHFSITVEKCYCLDANEAIIVYKNEKNEFSRKIINGPGIFYIQPNEWLHSFNWHGVIAEHKTKYAPNNNFEVLNCAPNQLYYNVEDVRTSDDALLTVKLMIFYELVNIEKMLNETKDPIADLINFCTSDVIEFTASGTYLQFIENCHKLNDLFNYKKLVERSKVIGFDVTKVVFRGYYASPKLQSLHNIAIQTRTQLKLEHESHMQEHERVYLNLKNDISRLSLEQNLELQKLENNQKLEKSKTENELNLKLNEFISQEDFNKEIFLKEIQMLINENSLKYEHLQKLKELKIDLTEYLLSSFKKPSKVIQIVKKQQNEKDSEFSNIHFHE